MSSPDQPHEPSAEIARVLAGATRAEVSKEADPNTAKERAVLESYRFQAETGGLEQDIAERKKYASRFFFLSCAWLISITAVLMLQGFGGFWRAPFKLSDSIVLALIGATTVNVIGILYVVANYLFPKRGGAETAGSSAKP